MKYYLTQDNDSHWYIVPVDSAKLWDEFCAIDSEDPRSWDVPTFARQVGGSPSLVHFENPTIDA